MKSIKIAPLFVFLFVACGSPTVTNIGKDWKSVEKDLQTQLILARDSSVITLPEGNFQFSRSLLVDGKKNLTIRGAGIDKTILSFEFQEEGAEGIKIANGKDIVLEDFTIQNAKGDNIKVSDTRGITFRRIKSQWTGEPKEENGAYGFYPVICKQVLIEDCIAIGSSDAGIYVGQSDSVIIRRNEAYYNVAGIESENSKWVEVYENYAHDNTGGILIFDLPGLTQYGHTTRVFDNRTESNNFRNFAPKGNVVASVPPGTGILFMATHRAELFNNQIIDNRTVGVGIASYDLVAALGNEEEGSQLNENIEIAQMDENYDPYPNDLYIHDNSYDNSYLFPSLESDFGLLFLTKFPLATPDVVWDGIAKDRGLFSLCVKEKENIAFADLDAANDFQDLTSDLGRFGCEGTTIQPIFP